MAGADCAQRTYFSEHTLKFLRILVDIQQRYAALKVRLVKRDHVPQSAMINDVMCINILLHFSFVFYFKKVKRHRIHICVRVDA